MATALAEKALAYLRDHNVMTLATVGPDGPWAAAVFYANDGFELYFLSSLKSRHGVNIGGRADVSAAIQEDYRDWREIKGIQLEGRAVELKGDEKRAAIDCYGRKFPFIRAGVAQIASALALVSWFRLAPSRFYFIDNSLGLGHRDELVLPRPRRGAGR